MQNNTLKRVNEDLNKRMERPTLKKEMEKMLFGIVKRRFHYSWSWGEVTFLLSYFLTHCSDWRLKVKMLSKFLWYRVIHYRKDRNFKKFTPLSASYSRCLQNIAGERKKMLIFTYEMSLTGAPRTSLALAVVAKELGMTPVLISPNDGSLTQESERLGVEVLIDPLLSYHLATSDGMTLSFLEAFDVFFFNALESVVLAPYVHTPHKKIGWIHEGSFGFSNNVGVDIGKSFDCLDELYAVGGYTKRFVEEHAGDKTKVKTLLYGCEDYVPVGKSVTADKDEKLRIAVIGTIDRRKGLHLLAEALKGLSAEAKGKITIDLIGKAREHSILSSLHALPFVNVIGQKPHKEVLRYLAEADVLLCPSLDDPMPIVCTEAMMLRKVVVVSENTGTALFIKNGVNGFTIPANDIEAITHIIEYMVSNTSAFAQIGDAAREIYERYFTFDVFRKNVGRIFCEFVAQESDAKRLPSQQSIPSGAGHPTISFILPFFNSAPYLDKCIESILSQTSDDYELILVDDGSTDNSLDLCKAYAQKHRHLKLLHYPENKGVSYARNLGMAHAQGKYVSLVDADDWIEPSYVETIRKEMEDTDILFFDVAWQYKDESTLCKSIGASFAKEKAEIENVIVRLKDNDVAINNFGYTFSKVFRRDLICAHGIRFVENLQISEDETFTYAYCKHIGSIKVIPTALYNYRQKKDGLSHRKKTMQETLLLFSELSKIDWLAQLPFIQGAIPLPATYGQGFAQPSCLRRVFHESHLV